MVCTNIPRDNAYHIVLKACINGIKNNNKTITIAEYKLKRNVCVYCVALVQIREVKTFYLPYGIIKVNGSVVDVRCRREGGGADEMREQLLGVWEMLIQQQKQKIFQKGI